jgi:hypothetical protein
MEEYTGLERERNDTESARAADPTFTPISLKTSFQSELRGKIMTTTSFDTMTHDQVEYKITNGENNPKYAKTLVKDGVTYHRLFGILYRDVSQEAVLEARRYGYLATKIKVQGMFDKYWDVYAARKLLG